MDACRIVKTFRFCYRNHTSITLANLSRQQPQQKTDAHSGGREQRRDGDKLNVAASILLVAHFKARFFGKIRISIRRNNYHITVSALFKAEYFQIDKLSLQIVVGTIGKGTPKQRIGISFCQRAFVIDKTVELAFLRKVKRNLHVKRTFHILLRRGSTEFIAHFCARCVASNTISLRAVFVSQIAISTKFFKCIVFVRMRLYSTFRQLFLV